MYSDTGAHRMRRRDRRAMAADRGVAQRVDRHDQHLRGALEGVGEGRRIVVVARAHPHAALGQRGRGLHVADADPDPRGRHALEQALDDRPAQLPVCSGNNDIAHRLATITEHC